jgi:uncharacterized protein (DUF1330 family)
MRLHHKIAAAVLAGAVLGALAVEGLHAQMKSPVYYIVEIDVGDPDAYASGFASKAQAMIKKSGGRFLAVGGAGSSVGKVTALEGDPPKRVVVQLWDSVDQLQAWRASPEYQAIRKVGEQYAKFRAYAVDSLPQ